MFLFNFNKSRSLVRVDIHSHLLPNIDDGAKNLEESIFLIQELKKLGYSKLIITPHINSIYSNSESDIFNKFSFLQEELIKREIKIDIDLGAEYCIDDNFIELLYKKKEFLSFGKNKYLLFEFPHHIEPLVDIDNFIYELHLNGYTPVLAHPERYVYWYNSLDKFIELKEMDILFQLNLNSLNGYYGLGAKLCSKWLIKKSYIDFVGSDTHHITSILNLKKVLNSSIYKSIFNNNNILNNNF
jgi:tyrosine-protein phosphatase YwqE